MWGPEGATRAVAENLSTLLPVSLARLRSRSYANPEHALEAIPEVAAIYPTPVEFADISRYPAIMISPVETQGQFDTRALGSDGVTETYTFTYRIRALIYVMGTTYDSTELLCQRITLAVREALLLNKRYGDLEGDNGGQIDPSLVRESYAQTTGGTAPFLSASYVEFGIRSRESLAALSGPVEISGATSTLSLLSPIPIADPLPPGGDT